MRSDGRGEPKVDPRFFAVYAGGYAIWLAYGASIGSMPLIVVDAIGVVCATATLGIVLSPRGSLLHPSTWNSCPIPTRRPRRSAPVSQGVALAVAALDPLPDVASGRSAPSIPAP